MPKPGPERENTVIVIGGGPAGLMAAEVLATNGHPVCVADAKPSFGRKFLMAGKSGLNLTKAETTDRLVTAYGEAADWLRPMLSDWDADAVQNWARGLGTTLFTGSTGRVFPVEMKASPLLRAWLARLDELGVTFQRNWRWRGWQSDGALWFDTADGQKHITPKATILALGGASWKRLGSDGAWSGTLTEKGVSFAPFQPSNAGLLVNWSPHMHSFFGAPLKSVAFHCGDTQSRGEAVISARGLEGGGLYAMTPALRQGAPLHVDLIPDLDHAEIAKRLASVSRKQSTATRLRKKLGLSGARLALLNEFARPLPTDQVQLARVIKNVEIRHAGLRPLDEAISTAGGVPRTALTEDLMLIRKPGVFCAGEMLDWEAPTGGYLLTACFATGKRAAQGASDYLKRDSGR